MLRPDWIASSWHCVWVHHPFEISVLLRAPSLVQTNVNYWGLSRGCTEGGSWFPNPLLPLPPSSNLPYVDERFHAVGWFSLTVFKVVSSEWLGAYHCEVSSVIMCINCHMMWKKFNMNHFFWNPNTFVTILPADSCVLNFTGLLRNWLHQSQTFARYRVSSQ